MTSTILEATTLEFWWEGFMKYAIEMDSGGMIYIQGFMTIVSSIHVT
jgi:hypothetical protein